MNKKIKDILSNSKLKVTETRCSILKALFESKIPQNYEQLKTKISLDKATFYRNMNIFEKKGIINRFESKNRVWYYELGQSKHAHFMCEICNAIICLDTKLPFNTNECLVTNMVLKGRCKNCKNL